MAIEVSAGVDWNVGEPAGSVLLVRVADAPDQRLLHEELTVDGGDIEDPRMVADLGARVVRVHATGGPVSLRYRARVELDRAGRPEPAAELPDLNTLDLSLMRWTLPSRYCPADELVPTADSLFGELPRDGTLLEAVRAWVERSIVYTPGVSDAYTTATETLLRRAGVCRDLAHLCVSLLRALGVPARMVACYALDLEPQDFHALVEAHDGTAWQLMDATGLAPVESTARIATGRDAADIAWATTGGPMDLRELAIAVARV